MLNCPRIAAMWMACIALMAATLSHASESAFYVSPNGKDSWSGTVGSPTPDGSDGPFATLERARDVIRELKRTGKLTAPVEVRIQPGDYTLNQPFRLTQEDTGTAIAPITYVGEGDGKPIFSGGRKITGWQRGENGIWETTIPEVKSGEWYFRSLFVNGERRPRAIMPNDGYFRMAGEAPAPEGANDREKERRQSTAFRFRSGDIKTWEGWRDANVITYHSWTSSRFFIQDIDTENRIVEIRGRSRYPFHKWEKTARYQIENVPAALDAPGEWYLDRESGILKYIPMSGEDPRNAEIIAPVLTNLVDIEGDADSGNYIEHLTLSNISFQYAEWPIDPDEGHSFSQSAIDRSGGNNVANAVEVDGAKGLVLKNLEVAHVGGYGISLGHGCKENRIDQCHIHDLGAGGVKIGETSVPDEERGRTEENTVYNCFIHDGSHVIHSGVGVWIGRSSHNNILHNDICDFYYTGVSVGWSWGYQPSTADDNHIEFNHIHHLGYGVLSDMGGIYTLGRAPNTTLRYNRIHHVEAYSYGGWGIYPDEGSTGLLIENNIVYRTKTGGFHQHYGMDNRVRNNIFALTRQNQLERTRNEEHRSFIFKNNIVFYDRGKLLGKNWQGGSDRFEMDRNVYWDDSGEPVLFAGKTLKEWRTTGHDQASTIADPLFYDPYNYDFRLKGNSPALELGFEPIETDKIGLLGSDEWVRQPETVERDWPDFWSSDREIADDFDDYEIGSHPVEARISGADGPGSIEVVADPDGGDRCLRFVDAKGLERGWHPHLYYNMFFGRGRIDFHCDLRIEEGATLYFELRDDANPYHVGPSLWIHRDGTVKANGREIGKMPADTWVRFGIECGLGAKADGTYNLKMSVTGQGTRAFEDLACDREFRQLAWLGYSSVADEHQVFYLDNFNLRIH